MESELASDSHEENVSATILECADREIRRTARTTFPTLKLIPVYSSLTLLGELTASELKCDAELVSSIAPDQQMWRATIWTATSSDPAQRAAEVTALYRVKNAASIETDQPSLKTSGLAPVEARLTEKRRQIFNGACRAIAKKGFGNATIREIASESGMSVPLLYKYIKDKDEILYLITHECMIDIITYFEKELIGKRTPTERLKIAIERYVEYIDINRKYINLVYSETRALNRESRDKIFELERHFLSFWEEIIESGIEAGEFRRSDTRLTANYVYFVCTTWSLRHWNLQEYQTQEVKRTLTEFVLSGVTARRETQFMVDSGPSGR